MYTYKDFATNKTKRTSGEFVKWSKPTGPLKCRYAIFRTPKTLIFVPEHCLTPETKERLPHAE